MRLDDSTRTLLYGLLLPDAEARTHLEEWCRQTDLDSVDSAIHRLLPLLYRRLVDLELSPSDLDRLRGVYRKTWYRNQRHRAAAEHATRALTGTGIDVSLVGGLALALFAYDELGLRMVDAAQIVVPRNEIDRGIEKLLASGFAGDARRHRTGFGLPVSFTHEGGGRIEVREFVYGPGWPEPPDGDIWARRVTTHFAGMEIRVLSPTDAVAETITSEATKPLPSYLWLIDMLMLARRPALTIGWEDVIDAYRDTPLFVPISEAIELVRAELPVEVLGWRLPTRRLRPTVHQRLQFLFHRRGRRLARLPAWYRRGKQMSGGRLGFLRFAASVYDVHSPGEAITKLHRRIRRA